MRVLQPIEWTVDGKTFRGIVTEVLPEKKGVVARSTDEPDKAVVVTEPHKIRDVEEMAKIWKALGIKPVQAVDAGHLVKKHVYKPNQPEHTEEHYQSTFDKALAEVELAFSPDAPMIDKLHLYGMGFNPTGLPEADPNTTPINKLFF